MLKSLAQKTILYSIINFMVRSCTYLVVWLQINVLTPNDYGIIAEFQGSYMELGQILYGLAMDMTYCRFVYKLGEAYTFSAITSLLLTTSLVFSIVIVIALPQIAQIIPTPPIKYFYYMIPILTLDTLCSLAYARLRVANKTLSYVSFKSLEAFSHVAFSFVLLYFPSSLTFINHMIGSLFHVKVQADRIDTIFMANLLKNMVTFIFLLPKFKAFRWTWNKAIIRKIWHYASVSFFADLFFSVNKGLPILLFRRLVVDIPIDTTREVLLAGYATAWKLTVSIRLGIQAFKAAAEPLFFSNANRQDAPSLYSRTMSLFIHVACFALGLLSLNVHWIAPILIPNKAYLCATNTIPYLAFICVLWGIYYNLSVALKLNGQQSHRIWINFCGSITTGIIAWLWIPKSAHWGCVYASMGGAIVMVLLGYHMGEKCYPIPYDPKGVLLLLVTFIFLGKIPLLITKLSFIGIVWTYVWLNVTVVTICSIIGFLWYKSIDRY